jgi:flagellar L-ring protein precursor FlgH
MIYALILALTLSAQAKKPPAPVDERGPPARPIAVEPSHFEATVTPGSLWREVPARQMMGLDGNARQVGDLITVRITEQTTSAVGAKTNTLRENTNERAISALLGAEKTLLSAHPNMGGSISIGTTGNSTFRGDGSTSRNTAIEARLTCEVIDVLPSGNLRIWGWKQVRVNREVQYVVLDGITRPRDIRMDNTVTSDLLAQAKIEITGRGVVSDRQGPGIGTRILDWMWPF